MEKNENETQLQYIKRILDGKLNKEYDLDYSEVIKLAFGEEFHSDNARKMLYLWRLLSPHITEENIKHLTDNVVSEIDNKNMEIKKERMKLSDQRTALNKILKVDSRFETYIDLFVQAIENSDLPQYEYDNSNIILSDNNKKMVVAFSDFHYGAQHDNYWGKYNNEIFEKRFFEYIDKIIQIGKQHSINEINVIGLGDLISGNIQMSLRVTNYEDIISQTQKISEYISMGLNGLSKNFSKVNFYNLVGNHGRVNANKDEALYVENFERFITWWLKTRLSNVENINITDDDKRVYIDKSILSIDLFDYKIFAVHGDRDSMSNIVQNLSLMCKVIPNSIWLGHMHHFAVKVEQNVNIIMSGSLCGTDDYAKDLRKTGSPSQVIAIYNSDGLECLYNVKFDVR